MDWGRGLKETRKNKTDACWHVLHGGQLQFKFFFYYFLLILRLEIGDCPVVHVCRGIWKEKSGVWPLILTSRSVPPLAMTKPCAYGTSRPATACWLCANSEKVRRRSHRGEMHCCQASDECAVFLRRPLLLLLPRRQSLGSGPE